MIHELKQEKSLLLRFQDEEAVMPVLAGGGVDNMGHHSSAPVPGLHGVQPVPGLLQPAQLVRPTPCGPWTTKHSHFKG